MGSKTRAGSGIDGRFYDEEITLELEDPPGKQAFHLAASRPELVRGDFWCAHESLGFTIVFNYRLSVEEYARRRLSNRELSKQRSAQETEIQNTRMARGSVGGCRRRTIRKLCFSVFRRRAIVCNRCRPIIPKITAFIIIRRRIALRHPPTRQFVGNSASSN